MVRLLANADAALVVWIHILVFDQLVGVFIYRDNMRERVAPLPVQSAILFLTLMFGPAGFLVYTRSPEKHSVPAESLTAGEGQLQRSLTKLVTEHGKAAL